MIPRAVVTVNGEDISCDVRTGVSIIHGRDRPGEQPEPATAQLDLIAATRDTIDKLAINALVVIEAHFPGDDFTVTRFRGQITDVDLSWDTVDYADVRVLCASPVAVLNRTFIGDQPWPLEIDGSRAARILSVVQSVPYAESFSTGLGGWAANGMGASAAWNTAGHARVQWGAPGLQVFQKEVTGLLPGGAYVFSATVRPGTAGCHQVVPPIPPGGFGQAARMPDTGWVNLAATFTADGDGKMLLQFWPTDVTVAGQYCYITQVTLTAAHQVPIGQIDPGSVNVLARDVDRQPCYNLLASLAEDAAGMAWHTRAGAICYADSEHRRNTPSALTLNCGQVLMAPQWTLNTGGLINDTTVSYGTAPGGEGEQPTVRSSSAQSIADYGRLETSQTTQLADVSDAQFRADLTIARAARPVWDLTQLPVDLTLPGIDEQATRTLLELEIHSLLTVTGFPSQGPASTASLWVEGWDETIESLGDTGVGNWLLNLHVSNYCRTSAFARWDDIPEVWTWDTAPPAMTWDDAVCLGPPAPGGERWSDVPANTRWNAVPASVTWDTWNAYIGG